MKFFTTLAFIFLSFYLFAQESEIVQNNPLADFELGTSVDISEDGHYAIAGLPGTGTTTGRAFIYTLIDNNWVKTAELMADDGAADDAFGTTVSISQAGTYAAVGAPLEDEDGMNSGAVYIFYFDGNGWTPQAKLKAMDQADEDQFGNAVSISDDGNYIVVGAKKKDASTTNYDSGAAYIFKRDNTTWTQQTKLNPLTLRFEDEFGTAVSMDRTGENVIVGSPLDDNEGTNSGSVYAFKRTNDIWTMTVELTASNPSPGAKFGTAVALNADATRAAVGAPFANNTTGSVYVFFKTSNGFMQMNKLNPDNFDADQQFGQSVGISENGNWLVVGAPGDNTAATKAGATYVFKAIINDWSWVQTCKTVATYAGTDYQYGFAVTISDAGDRVLVGSPFADDYATNSGAVYAFNIINETCTAPQFIPHGARLGNSVDISADGNYCLIGAPLMTQNGQTTGLVYVYRNNAGVWVQEAQLLSNDISSGDCFGWSLAINGNGTQCVIGAPKANSTTGRSGAAYVFNRVGNTWLQEAKLQPTSALPDDMFGAAVDISKNVETVVVGVPGNIFEAEDSGTAYIFSAADFNWTRSRILARIDAQIGDQFGTAVAINANGNYAMVGAPYAGTAGRVYSYSLGLGQQWQRLQAISPEVSDGTDLAYGASLALNDAGITVLVGAPGEGTQPTYQGAAFVLNQNNGSWWPSQKIQPADGQGMDAFGASVAMANEETYLAIGATGNDEGAINGGATYIYEFSTGTWQPSNKVIATDLMDEDAYGYEVALSGDADHLVVGSPRHDHTGVDNGAAYKYQCFASALAIELLDFMAINDKNGVQLDWALVRTDNVEQFHLQRSTNSADFKTIATITSKNNQTTYTFHDQQVLSGETYYYRLEIQEMDGRRILSGIKTVHLAKEHLVDFYPNPTQKTLHFSYPSDENYQVEIWTISGQLMVQEAMSPHLNIEHLSTGTYILKMIKADGSELKSQVLVKE